MIQLLIAILLGLACPSDSNYVQDNTVVTTSSTEEGGDGDGTGGTGTGTGTGTGGVGGNTGQLPPPPIVGG